MTYLKVFISIIMLNSTSFTFQLFPNFTTWASVSSIVKLGFSCLVIILRKHSSCLGAVFLFCIQIVSAMSPRQVFVSQWGNEWWRTSWYLWQARIKREKKTEGNNSGSNFNTVCDFKDYFLLHNVYLQKICHKEAVKNNWRAHCKYKRPKRSWVLPSGGGDWERGALLKHNVQEHGATGSSQHLGRWVKPFVLKS